MHRRWKPRFKRYTLDFLRSQGVELHRVPPTHDGPFVAKSHYDVAPTCQVLTLACLYELYFGVSSSGTFVEVGAYDGWTFSNTSCLAGVGWTGHYIEPTPTAAAACRARYADHGMVKVHELAIGAAEEDVRIFLGGQLSTANPSVRNEYQSVPWASDSFAIDESIVVRQTTLDRFLDRETVRAEFDLLVVDVEGLEVDVFAGFDLQRWRPAMLIVELTDAHPDLIVTRRSHASLLVDLTNGGYITVYKDSINTVLVTQELYARTHHIDTRAPLR